MRHSTLLVYNTLASYVRIIVTTVITLLATRIALKHLGADDFGLYNLIAGIVVLLSFFNGSLMISCQRFFSILIGENSLVKLGKYYNASIGIHIGIGALIGIVLLFLTPFLFNGFLNIQADKIIVAKTVYFIMIISAVITVGTIPFSAIMNAREDLVILSLCDIVSSIVKLLAAVSLLFFQSHLLVIYSIIMIASVLVKMLFEFFWVNNKYKETHIFVSQFYNKDIYRDMLGFIGWNTLGSVAVLVRSQGVAIVLNIFFGTIVNAAYGIANQVNSLVLSFSSTLTTVFAPMIIQAKGAKNEKRMLETAIFSSKLSFLLSTMMALPILLFLPQLLFWWLGGYPESTEEFCRYIIFSFLVLQLYPGINRAIYATGNIKGYQISISIFLVAIIPIGCIFFKMGYPPYSIMIVMLFFQIMALISTIYYAKKYCSLNVKTFIINSVLVPVCIFSSLLFLFNSILSFISSPSIWGILCLAFIFEVIYTFVFLLFTLNRIEKSIIINYFHNIF